MNNKIKMQLLENRLKTEMAWGNIIDCMLDKEDFSLNESIGSEDIIFSNSKDLINEDINTIDRFICENFEGRLYSSMMSRLNEIQEHLDDCDNFNDVISLRRKLNNLGEAIINKL